MKTNLSGRPCSLFALLAAVVFAGICTAAAQAVDVEITGAVRGLNSGQPIPGALVSLQASGLRTITAADGTFSLFIPNEAGSVIVAASKSFFNRSAIYDGVATKYEILLEAVPQDNDPTYAFTAPMNCGFCHPDQFEQWNNSRMQRAGLNTWVHDIFNGDGTPDGAGGFVYTRDSAFAKSNPGSECASCHQPESWITAPFSRMEGPSDLNYPSNSALHGVSCDVCHKIAHVDVDKINFPGIYPGAVTFTRPAAPDYFQVVYGLLGDVDFEAPYQMRASYQPQLAAEACGACHQDKNDPHENGTYDGVISEPTYLEWADSPYGDLDSPLYASCVDCHMPPSGATQVCEILFPPLERDPETIRTHDILGTTPEYLENAADVYLDVKAAGDVLHVDVEVVNSQTGHHVPTGVTVRNVILLVEAWREQDGLVLESTGSQVVHDLGGIGDPADGYYAGLPGKFFAKVNHDANGNGPTFFTDAVGIQFDSRIPALASDTTSYTFAIPSDGGELHVRARLIYRRAFRFLVDAKQWTENGHGSPLEDVQPPYFGHLMESVEGVVTTCGAMDFDGDQIVGFSDLIRLLAAWGPCAECPEDLDDDGTVGFADLLQILVNWGACS